MTTRTRAALVAAALTSVFALTACKKQEAPAATPAAAEPAAAPTAIPAAAVTVTDVSLGKSVGRTKKVQTATDTFAPKDTIFASVSTDGSAPSSIIAVKWTFGDGQTVREDSKTIAPTGPAVTEFSIQKPKGWPKGNYKIDVTVDAKETRHVEDFHGEVRASPPRDESEPRPSPPRPGAVPPRAALLEVFMSSNTPPPVPVSAVRFSLDF